LSGTVYLYFTIPVHEIWPDKRGCLWWERCLIRGL